MKELILPVALGCAVSSAAWGEEVDFNADTDVKYISAYEGPTGTEVQFVAPRAGALTCIVLGHSGEPIASGFTYADIGSFPAPQVAAKDVGGLLCRYSDMF